MKNLVVVIDMVNGFVHTGPLSDKNINKVTPNIKKLLNKAVETNTPIVAFRDCHSVNDEEFNTYPVHCLKGSVESEIIPELNEYKKYFIDIEKNTTNGFNTGKFLNIAFKNNFDKVYVCGCCTDICVKDFVLSYLNFLNKTKRNTQIIVLEDACYTFDGQNHNANKCHNEALKEMENAGATIKTISPEYTK
mgnify:CR=1 FL=1